MKDKKVKDKKVKDKKVKSRKAPKNKYWEKFASATIGRKILTVIGERMAPLELHFTVTRA